MFLWRQSLRLTSLTAALPQSLLLAARNTYRPISRLSSNMANQERPPLPSQPSLQELCEMDIADSDFASLEPRMQQRLFRRLRTENARLREVESKWCGLTASCPRTDTQIYLYGWEDEKNEYEQNGHDQNSHDQEAAFPDKWSYPIGDSDKNESDGGDGRGLETIRNIRWERLDLCSESPDSDLRLCVHQPDRFNPWAHLQEHLDHGFSHRVSSQLLLYRLTVTFGMPPPKPLDGYKSCWEVDLQHCDGASVLSFYDYKGGASTQFYGTTEASADALKLLNYLVGMKCRHTYDGTLAGTMA